MKYLALQHLEPINILQMMPFSRQGQLLKLLNQKDANWWFSFIYGRIE